MQLKRHILICCFAAGACQRTEPQPSVDPLHEMIEIPAGPFWRGCDPAVVEAWGGICESDPANYFALDVPFAQVELSTFWIDKYEATIGDYVACFEAGVCQPIGTVAPSRYDEQERARLPINGLTWPQAEAYCAWRGKRLLTEAEWEKAARGTDQRQLPWGDDYSQCGIANLILAQGACEEPRHITPVDAYPEDRSPYGVIGMAGNVQEWVADWSSVDYYELGPKQDPQGPAEADPDHPHKIIRGSYHGSGPPGFRVSLRRWSRPDDGHLGRVGVRCGSSVPPDEIDDPLTP